MRTDKQIAVRTYVRAREDFQAMRKRMDNRIGRKADGKSQELKESRIYNEADLKNFDTLSVEARKQEGEISKMLKNVLKEFPVYTEWLVDVKGVGEIASGWIVGEFDIEKATTVSKMWQYSGLNPGMVRGKIRVEVKKYKEEMGEIIATFVDEKGKPEAYIILTNELIRGDKATPGFLLPFNKRLRTALIGVLAPGFIKCKSPYALEHYYPYKARLEQEENKANGNGKAWKDVSKGHRDNAARRFMIKAFLRDLYAAWRDLEGLPVRVPYQEEYLGHKHVA